MIWNNFKMAFVSLRNAKLRSFLTMLGVIIGVGSVVAITSIGEGVKRSVTGQISSLGSNIVQINPGQAFTEEDGEGGGGGGFNIAASFGASTLREKDLQTIRDLDNVEAVTGYMLISGIAKAGDKTSPGALIGAVSSQYLDVFNFEIDRGKFFDEADDTASVAVIGSSVAEDLYAGGGVDQSIDIRGQQFKVIGILKPFDTGGLNLGPDINSVIYIPFGTGKLLNDGSANIIEIDARVDSADNVERAVDNIKQALIANHGGQEDFSVLTQEQQLELFNSILSILTSFIAAIAAISLIVGGIGIMNIMLVSVTERTREIGIRKALGATRNTILAQFLIESVAISIIGGALGVGLAFVQGIAVKRLADITPAITLDVIVMAVSISVAIGIIFGMAPAIRAAKKRPVEALRYE
jgi:ABC-type antimicrobial peptide transport system permease subunit